MTTNPEVYFIDGCGRCSLGGTPQCKVHTWKAELARVRALLLDCGLTEESKWGSPCYTYKGNNIILLSAFKEYCCISFFKGALLQDKKGILVQQTKNVQATRQVRFTNVKEIAAQENLLKSYIFEAIEIEKAGLKVALKKTSDYEIPEELLHIFSEDEIFKSAFYALTPGRQRGYLLHFAAPKQSKTRTSRIEKAKPDIFIGKGIHDR